MQRRCASRHAKREMGCRLILHGIDHCLAGACHLGAPTTLIIQGGELVSEVELATGAANRNARSCFAELISRAYAGSKADDFGRAISKTGEGKP